MSRIETKDGRFAVLVEPDNFPKTLITYQIGDEARTGRFAFVGWSAYANRENILTTHPALVEEMMEDGPLALEPLVENGQDADVMSILLPRGYGINIESKAKGYRMVLDAANGRITFFTQSVADNMQVEENDIPRHYQFALPVYHPFDAPQEVFETANFEYQINPMVEKIPTLGKAFADLGFDGSKKAGYKTLPVPSAYARGMQHLRETDTTSGIYYPHIDLLPVGKIDAQTYLLSYAKGHYPIGTKSFFNYDHDGAGVHPLAYKVHGDMAMDVASNYSQSIIDAEVATFGYNPRLKGRLFEGLEKLKRGAVVVDAFSDVLGRIDITATHREVQRSERVYDDIVNTLRLDGRLENLKIVQWMQEQRKVQSTEEIDGAMLLEGLLDYARERFSIST